MNGVQAGLCVAEKFGLRVDQPVLLRSTNNVVVWLRPSAVVAKIGVGHHGSLSLEVSVASELSALGAPVISLAPEIPPIVHVWGDFQISFWRYYPQPADVDIPAEPMAAALRRLHEAYTRISTQLRVQLPSYVDELRSVSKLLLDPTALPALPESDRHLLIRVFDRLWNRLPTASLAETQTVIHGSPHPYNVLLVDGQPCFIDFETTCIGPMEWDLAHTSPDTASNYAGTVDSALLDLCRDMVRVKTAAWCWADVDRGDLRYHAENHLAYLKKVFS